jgi:dihydrofolate reductase
MNTEATGHRGNPRVSAIASLGKNRELGRAGDLLWRIPEDLTRVRELTMGHPLIMGRATYESIGRPLPGRTTIIVTRQNHYNAPGCVVVSSLPDALAHARTIDNEEVFIFGGAQLYAEALPETERLYLTLIDAEDSSADAFFPPYEAEFPTILSEEAHSQADGPAYTWVTRERAPQG